MPGSFTLAASGKVSDGITVKPVMKKQRTIGLVVYRQPSHSEVDTVLLGTFSAHPSIHWNLKVHGTTMSSGKYQVYLRVFTHGKPRIFPHRRRGISRSRERPSTSARARQRASETRSDPRSQLPPLAGWAQHRRTPCRGDAARLTARSFGADQGDRRARRPVFSVGGGADARGVPARVGSV